jgi:hypothetical protein
MPSGATWNNTETNAMLGIDMGKLFQAGYLTLNGIVETAGSNPVFYGFTNGSDSGTKISDPNDIASYDALGFKIGMTKIKALAPKSLDSMGNEITLPLFPVAIGEPIYRKYYP